MSNWSEQLKIDRFRLDDMLVEQPQVYWEVANAYALAVSRRDELKERSVFVMATVSNRIRTESEKKPPEAAIAHMIELDEEYTAARGAYLKAKTTADELIALKGAYEQRAHMLRDLAQLYIAGYFSDDSVRRQQAASDQTATSVARKRISTKRQALRSDSDG